MNEPPIFDHNEVCRDMERIFAHFEVRPAIPRRVQSDGFKVSIKPKFKLRWLILGIAISTAIWIGVIHASHRQVMLGALVAEPGVAKAYVAPASHVEAVAIEAPRPGHLSIVSGLPRSHRSRQQTSQKLERRAPPLERSRGEALRAAYEEDAAITRRLNLRSLDGSEHQLK
ncbi:hypothetical protein [Sphingomonas nostoxanthinifaciens]|uniref:hypothetical protein n=1 Tax=Sphingomonas nostoxanthinifaciens TaxID=2872652 RepID=UPI001CC1D8FE|nr:hypothetical protein [Sphingomonas nostoxanthinifaciens]UAK25606.1 hypothetical protein K8P63_05505 [Sphingomonas nostoxanthinifaciens]